MLPEEAIEYVLEHTRRGDCVVEFGSGHGSQRLAQHLELHSVEHDPIWVGISTSTYILAPIVANTNASQFGQQGWYDENIVQSAWPPSPTCVIIDGPPGSIGRHGVLSVLHLLQDVDFILVDDVDRPSESSLVELLAERLSMLYSTHDVVKPRKDGTKRMFAVLQRGE